MRTEQRTAGTAPSSSAVAVYTPSPARSRVQRAAESPATISPPVVVQRYRRAGATESANARTSTVSSGDAVGRDATQTSVESAAGVSGRCGVADIASVAGNVTSSVASSASSIMLRLALLAPRREQAARAHHRDGHDADHDHRFLPIERRVGHLEQRPERE